MSDKLNTPEARKIVTNIVEKAGLNDVESFIMAEVAADFLKGIRWVLLYKDSPQFKGKLDMLKAAVQEGQLQNKVGLQKLEDGYIVELDTELMINTIKSMQNKLPGVDVQQDLKLAHEAYKRTRADFEKYLKGLRDRLGSSKSISEVVGIYCTNETPKITYNGTKGLVSVPAFRLAVSDLFHINQSLRATGLVLEYGKFKLSPSRTGVLTTLKLSKI